ncbi:hypothetical protein [uncultured Deefgea sp.]|uniref:hypothetical protein n=1 Tax=uncultured Deefgea sp. TaxID=1304914 RepID=UPI00262E33C2|nr:hypothetical protein [uncultured Deefgea sp.]
MTVEQRNVEFSGHIDRLHVGDTYHSGGRALTKIERNELNAKVRKLENDYGVPGWQPWKFLHRIFGVDSVEDMKLGQRDAVTAILDLLLDNAAQQARADQSARALIEQVQRNDRLNAELGNRPQTAQYTNQINRLTAELSEQKQRTNHFGLRAEKAETGWRWSDSIALRRHAKLKWLSALLCGSLMASAWGSYSWLKQPQFTNTVIKRDAKLCYYKNESYLPGGKVDTPGMGFMRCELENGVASWGEVAGAKPIRKTVKPRKPKVVELPDVVDTTE